MEQQENFIVFKMSFGFITPQKTIKLFSFPIFWFWTYLMKIIPETRCAH
jgi:hypothetical protein